MSKLNITPQDILGEANRMNFILNAFLNKQSFLNLAVVVNVDESKKKVDVSPMLYSRTAKNEKIDKGTVYGLPYFQLQRGSSAIIMNPCVGDIGLICVCDYDISNVKNTASKALPATNRSHNMADAIYLGGVGSINQSPTQYVAFLDDGINIVSPFKVSVDAPETIVKSDKTTVTSSTVDVTGTTTINGDTKINGNLNVTLTTTTNGLSVGGTGGGTAYINCNIIHVGNYTQTGNYVLHGNMQQDQGWIRSLGKLIDGTHKHNYSSGGGTTEAPNA